MAQRKPPVVHAAGLCKTFKDFWRRPRAEAVKDLNLEIQPGEVFGLLGPNGSGKTTTIKMLLGLLYPTSGRISVFGNAPTDVAVKARIGFLPEESYLYRFLVASETLDYFGRLFQLPARIRAERTERLLDMVGLRHEAKRPIGEYSKGMARRIGLAQALMNDPELLILDEPTSGLDPIGARQIKDVIRELGRKGKTILLSSHMLADVEDVCDRVVILYGGQEMACGDIGELLSEQNRTQLTLPALSESAMDKIQAIAAEECPQAVFEVTRPRQKLEQFFLQIVEQAQKKNIRTSGARAAGALPEFLKKPTEEVSGELVDSLIHAASVPAATMPEPSTPLPTAATADVQASKQVLADLLGADTSKPSDDSDERDTDGRPLGAEPPAGGGSGPSPSKAPPEADSAVIDALIQDAPDPTGDPQEDQP